MFGLNKRITIIETSRPFSDSGAVADEIETVLFSGIPAAIQSHVLNNLPPPGDRLIPGGRFYLDEYRCWITVASVGGLKPRTTWIIQDEATGTKYRIRGPVDDAGRLHHYLMRMEQYDG